MNLHQKCPSCNSEKLNQLDRYEKDQLVKCLTCNLVFTLKIPNNNELKSHYKEYSRKDYLSPITVNRYKELLLQFESFKKNGNILDIGCGIGYFLDQAKKNNWSVHGTEFTESAISLCEGKGIKMYEGDLNSIDFKEMKFDVITSFEVLEHLNDPKKHIQRIIELLRPGGLLYLTTPNFNSLNSRLLKEKWNVISYPEHLCYFDEKSLKSLLINSGFNVQKLHSEGISPGRLINSKRAEGMDFTSSDSQDENLRTSIEKNILLKFLKKIVNRSLSAFGLGETLKVWGIKS